MHRITTTVLPAAERLVTGATGTALTALFGTVARLRPTDKPLHPRGQQFDAVLHRSGAPTAWGVEWLDTVGTDAVLVRFSRAMGLPGSLPDILGLTLRVHRPDGPADLLFATTGTGPWSRFVLQPRRHRQTHYSTLMPYRTPAGPAWLLARFTTRADPPPEIELHVAGAGGAWQLFGRIRLERGQLATDPTISFDPIRNTIPGLSVYPWTARMREGAYAAARSSRAGGRAARESVSCRSF